MHKSPPWSHYRSLHVCSLRLCQGVARTPPPPPPFILRRPAATGVWSTPAYPIVLTFTFCPRRRASRQRSFRMARATKSSEGSHKTRGQLPYRPAAIAAVEMGTGTGRSKLPQLLIFLSESCRINKKKSKRANHPFPLTSYL